MGIACNDQANPERLIGGAVVAQRSGSRVEEEVAHLGGITDRPRAAVGHPRPGEVLEVVLEIGTVEDLGAGNAAEIGDSSAICGIKGGYMSKLAVGAEEGLLQGMGEGLAHLDGGLEGGGELLSGFSISGLQRQVEPERGGAMLQEALGPELLPALSATIAEGSELGKSSLGGWKIGGMRERAVPNGLFGGIKVVDVPGEAGAVAEEESALREKKGGVGGMKEEPTSLGKEGGGIQGGEEPGESGGGEESGAIKEESNGDGPRAKGLVEAGESTELFRGGEVEKEEEEGVNGEEAWLTKGLKSLLKFGEEAVGLELEEKMESFREGVGERDGRGFRRGRSGRRHIRVLEVLPLRRGKPRHRNWDDWRVGLNFQASGKSF